MKKVELSKQQAEPFRYLFKPLDVNKPEEWKTRNAVICAARGFGKSFLAATTAVTAVNELTRLDPGVPNKDVVIVSSTHSSVSSIYVPILNNIFGMEAKAKSFNSQTNLWEFPGNTRLRLYSFESVERLRGLGIYFLITDEMTSWSSNNYKTKDAWESVLYPCVTTRWSPMRAKILEAPSPGRTLNISTPKGYDQFYDLYCNQDMDSDWKSWHYSYKDSPFLSPEEIEKVKRTMDPLKFAREYEASFEESDNKVYYTFDRKVHVSDEISPAMEGEQLFVGLDFNVELMCSTISVERGNQTVVVDTYQGAPNTEAWCRYIWGRYGKTNPIAVFPDPTGNARKTSAPVGQTDFSIIENKRKDYPWNFKLFARKKSPTIKDSVAAVNRRFMNASGEPNLFIRKQTCGPLIRSLERTAWVDHNPDSLMIEKNGEEHFTDALRYHVEYLYPIEDTIRKAVVSEMF
jgi:hypothetical protein